jgi:hypothetical protein
MRYLTIWQASNSVHHNNCIRWIFNLSEYFTCYYYCVNKWLLQRNNYNSITKCRKIIGFFFFAHQLGQFCMFKKNKKTWRWGRDRKMYCNSLICAISLHMSILLVISKFFVHNELRISNSTINYAKCKRALSLELRVVIPIQDVPYILAYKLTPSFTVMI